MLTNAILIAWERWISTSILPLWSVLPDSHFLSFIRILDALCTESCRCTNTAWENNKITPKYIKSKVKQELYLPANCIEQSTVTSSRKAPCCFWIFPAKKVLLLKWDASKVPYGIVPRSPISYNCLTFCCFKMNIGLCHLFSNFWL